MLCRPLVIVSSEIAEHTLKTFASYHVAFFDVSSDTLDLAADWSCVIIDVPLSDALLWHRISDVLDRLPKNLPRLFVLDRKDRLEIVRANVLGATATANRPLSEQDAANFLKSNIGPIAVATADHTGHRIASGVLSKLFGAAGLNGVLDSAAINVAADEIATTLEDTGLEAWLRTVREHHQGTMQHCLIVAGVMTRFGQRLGMRADDVRMLGRIGLLHDVGKAKIPSAILDKPGKLSATELALVKTHPAEGFRFLAEQKNVGAAELDPVLGHHEYLDGSGYPHGLMDTSIGDFTRITTVCDIYGALVERRSYKPEMSVDSAMAIVSKMAAEGKVEGALVRALQKSLD